MADLPTNRTLTVQEEIFLALITTAHNVVVSALNQLGTKYKSDAVLKADEAINCLAEARRLMRQKDPE